MVRFGGKMAGQIASFGGNGVGQVLAAAAVALLLRLFSGPGPALIPEDEFPDDERNDAAGDDFPDTGKVVPVTIRWSNITCSLSDKSSKSLRFLLKNVSGEAKPGRLLAIMGPSGSGKTTLLNVLAGQLMSSPRLHLSGLLEVNGRPSSNRAYKYAALLYTCDAERNGYAFDVCLCETGGSFFSQLTVRETLSLAAELQLPEISSVEERDEYVNNLLFKLGLVSCADSNVGDAKVRGISGGEKKRLSLACELIASPSVIFADEPTTVCTGYIVYQCYDTDGGNSSSNARVDLVALVNLNVPNLACIDSQHFLMQSEFNRLDAFQAEKVMETLRQLAQDGHTVICSIHQPRGSVYSKFDDIVLLAEGALVYAGPARDAPLTYFSKFGAVVSVFQSYGLIVDPFNRYHCPDHVNPAEFLADLISVDYSSAESVYTSQKRIDGLVESFSQQSSTILYATPLTRKEDSKKLSKKTAVKGQGKGSWWRQFWLLLRRAWMQASRDGPTNKVRARMSVASAIIFGSVFWRMGKSQASIQDRMGLLQVAAINTAMAALTKTVGVFPKERAIVDRERAKGSYALGPYLLSKLIAEIPVGAAFPLMFGAVLYPMARLHPNFSRLGNVSFIPVKMFEVTEFGLVHSRFGKFCGIVTTESFAASAMGLTVGAMVPTTEAAMAVGPSLMTVFIVFGGYYVNADDTPIIFRWIPHVSLIRWAFQGLCINEFRGLQFDHQNSFDVETGEQSCILTSSPEENSPQFEERSVLICIIANVPIALISYNLSAEMIHATKVVHFLSALERLSFGGSRVKDTVVAQSRILLFWYCTTYLLLEKNKPRYQRLEPPSHEQIQSQLQLEPLDPNQVKQLQQLDPPPLREDESNQQLESPTVDQIRPFILEGLYKVKKMPLHKGGPDAFTELTSCFHRT
ncbi:unnamed protein product [Dovyalis caffra]|uniref:ABC transporter domain-containing protein n=1 Tax=Dovyalis caffra TaxID=77055 RepID=A0AAV1R1H3_9ROSI|nr:unnamed protein product [Dovyalis caffra]